MKVCDRLRPALLRWVENEASPAEALNVARHVDVCTACRIEVARARRLSSALNALNDAPTFDEEAFLRNVMAALPSAPPPLPSGNEARRRRAWIRRKRVQLAGVTVLALAAVSPIARIFPIAAIGGGGGLPRLTESPERASDVLSSLVTFLAVALEGLGRSARLAPPLPHAGSALGTGLALAGVAAAAAGALALAAAWRGRRLIS